MKVFLKIYLKADDPDGSEVATLEITEEKGIVLAEILANKVKTGGLTVLKVEHDEKAITKTRNSLNHLFE